MRPATIFTFKLKILPPHEGVVRSSTKLSSNVFQVSEGFLTIYVIPLLTSCFLAVVLTIFMCTLFNYYTRRSTSYQKPAIFASCYRPPKNTNNEVLFEEIKQPTSMQRKNLIWIGGDFSLQDIDWEVKSINNYQYLKQLNERFIDLIDSCSMEQEVNFPTRNQNILELLITYRPPFINKCISVPLFDDPIRSNLPGCKTDKEKDSQLEKS